MSAEVREHVCFCAEFLDIKSVYPHFRIPLHTHSACAWNSIPTLGTLSPVGVKPARAWKEICLRPYPIRWFPKMRVPQ